MLRSRIFFVLACAAASMQRLPAATTIIMEGSVTMIDGSVPPKPAGLERDCTGAAPDAGPITDRQGHYVWRLSSSLTNGRACFIQAQLAGFISTRFDLTKLGLSDYIGTHILTLPTLVLSPRDSGELSNLLLINDADIPDKAMGPWRAAVRHVEAKKIPEAIAELQKAVQRVPKFAEAWIVLGILYESQGQDGVDKARDAYRHATDANPKLLSPYLRLAGVYDQEGNWFAASSAADSLIKSDPRFYPQIYLYQAIARMGLKDLAGAENSANTVIRLDVTHKFPRAEYVLGLILRAKGDLIGAREHMANYLQLEPTAHDAVQIKETLDSLGH